MTSFVVDANVAFEFVNAPGALERLTEHEAFAPSLMWPEVRSALHVARWRGLLDEEDARSARGLLESGVFRERRHRRLGERTWAIADELAWAKTYDAEYLALADLLGIPVATFDQRVMRAAERIGVAVHRFI